MHKRISLPRTGYGLAASLLTFCAIAGLATTGLSALGALPWLSVTAAFGQTPLPWAGASVQIGVTVLLLSLLTVLPASFRILRLEEAHRRFEINMEDITQAYRAAHMADRAETFELQREFDAVRERYVYLKQLPEFSEMDDELTTIAAQMSEQSRDLAERYSDKRIEQLKHSLARRTQDIRTLEKKVLEFRTTTARIRAEHHSLEDKESEVKAQVYSLEDDVPNTPQPNTKIRVVSKIS